MIANSLLNTMGIYPAHDRVPLPRIGDFPNGLHTDLKFQNQAIQCFLLEPREGDGSTTCSSCARDFEMRARFRNPTSTTKISGFQKRFPLEFHDFTSTCWDF